MKTDRSGFIGLPWQATIPVERSIDSMFAYGARFFARPASIALGLALAITLAGCSGGSSSKVSPVAAAPTVTPTAAASATPPAYTSAQIDCTGCWPTYAHDFQRMGSQPETTITSANVSNLTPLWNRSLNEQVVASPIVDDGMAFVATGAGNVYALDQSTGSIVWKRNLGGPILETPTIDHGFLFVGTHTPPANFFALDVSTGDIAWQAGVTGSIRGPAAVADGVVYVGEAAGDPPICDQGGVHAYQATTGVQLFFWKTDSKPKDGGAVWSAISVDGPNVVFGTGNTCSNGVANANSLVRLTRAGAQEWDVPYGGTTTNDDDWGSGILVTGGRYYTANKDGQFYAMAPATGNTLWKATLSTFDGQGPIGTPTTDGTVVIMPSGNLQDGNLVAEPAVNFTAFSSAGSIVWTYPFQNIQRNYAAVAGGVAFLPADTQIVAVGAETGTKLWSYTSASDVQFLNGPAVTPVGLFTADSEGNVIVFAPATATSATSRRSVYSQRGPLNEPYGPIYLNRPHGGVRILF